MRVLKHESKLKARQKLLIEAVLPRFVVLSHVDRMNGVPDWSVTGNGITSWIEVKHATPSFYSHGIQVLTARRLAAAGRCRYVIFWESGEYKKTCIVHPNTIGVGSNPTMRPERFVDGHDFEFVLEYVRRTHNL